MTSTVRVTMIRVFIFGTSFHMCLRKPIRDDVKTCKAYSVRVRLNDQTNQLEAPPC